MNLHEFATTLHDRFCEEPNHVDCGWELETSEPNPWGMKLHTDWLEHARAILDMVYDSYLEAAVDPWDERDEQLNLRDGFALMIAIKNTGEGPESATPTQDDYESADKFGAFLTWKRSFEVFGSGEDDETG